MNINKLKAYDFRQNGNTLELDFAPEVLLDDILAMDTSLIEVRTDNDGYDDLVTSFIGYTKRSMTTDISSGITTLYLATGEEGEMLKAMNALKEQNNSLEARLNAIEEHLAQQQGVTNE